jgi:hypothetical protein
VNQAWFKDRLALPRFHSVCGPHRTVCHGRGLAEDCPCARRAADLLVAVAQVQENARAGVELSGRFELRTRQVVMARFCQSTTFVKERSGRGLVLGLGEGPWGRDGQGEGSRPSAQSMPKTRHKRASCSSEEVASPNSVFERSLPARPVEKRVESCSPTRLAQGQRSLVVATSLAQAMSARSRLHRKWQNICPPPLSPAP